MNIEELIARANQAANDAANAATDAATAAQQAVAQTQVRVESLTTAAKIAAEDATALAQASSIQAHLSAQLSNEAAVVASQLQPLSPQATQPELEPVTEPAAQPEPELEPEPAVQPEPELEPEPAARTTFWVRFKRTWTNAPWWKQLLIVAASVFIGATSVAIFGKLGMFLINWGTEGWWTWAKILLVFVWYISLSVGSFVTGGLLAAKLLTRQRRNQPVEH